MSIIRTSLRTCVSALEPFMRTIRWQSSILRHSQGRPHEGLPAPGADRWHLEKSSLLMPDSPKGAVPSSSAAPPDAQGRRMRAETRPRSNARIIGGQGRTARLSRSSRANADDRLPRASFGRVERRDGIVKGRDGADVCPQSSIPHALDDLTQLGPIGLDNEVDRQAVLG